ncbi:RNase H domain-containing protein [Aphis craccivora]|uniref:RNase H domain-containing protein n=1 Tax=Aphis craccivora TaxID=307492 RepID=A0A6G0ZEN3_APHCR|nr:RNase H domain-containing protein [Aphis craccivora]
MADKAADLATRIIIHPTISVLPTNDVKTSIKHKILLKWQKYWDTIPLSNKLKTIKKKYKEMDLTILPQQTI